jgi:hypothetical protein
MSKKSMTGEMISVDHQNVGLKGTVDFDSRSFGHAELSALPTIHHTDKRSGGGGCESLRLTIND